MVWFSNGGSKTEPFENGPSKRSVFECSEFEPPLTFEYRTSSVFKWLKPVRCQIAQLWMPFKVRTGIQNGRPFKIRTHKHGFQTNPYFLVPVFVFIV